MINRIVLSFTALFTLLVISTSAASTPVNNKQLGFNEKICGQAGCEQSFKDILTLAKNGSPRAKMIAGLMYMSGIGTQKDEQQSRKYLLASARAGSEIAQYAVGILYIQGNIFEYNLAKGNYWLAKSAKAGFEPAIKLTTKNDSKDKEDDVRSSNQYEAENQDNGHLVVTAEYLTLDVYADYLKKNTPYGRRNSTGSRIRGHHCADNIANCDTLTSETIVGELGLLRLLAPPGW